jgi:predicted RNA-binding protein YlqC (UPF0109 family)
VAEATDPAIELVEVIAKALVDEPDEVSASMAAEHRGLVRLTVAEGDLGKVIGKKGRTAKSIRAVLSAMGSKSKRRYALDIVEP